MICNRCGHANGADSRFCTSCGHPLEPSPYVPPPVPAPNAQHKVNVPAVILGMACALLAAVVMLLFLGVIQPIAPLRPAAVVTPGDISADDAPLIVCLLIAEDSAAWYTHQADDIAAAMEDAGYTLTVSEADRDAETQMIQLEDAIVAGADVVILEPVLAEACQPALQVAREAGVAVVLLGRSDELKDLSDTAIETGPMVASKLTDWLRMYW